MTRSKRVCKKQNCGTFTSPAKSLENAGRLKGFLTWTRRNRSRYGELVANSRGAFFFARVHQIERHSEETNGEAKRCKNKREAGREKNNNYFRATVVRNRAARAIRKCAARKWAIAGNRRSWRTSLANVPSHDLRRNHRRESYARSRLSGKRSSRRNSILACLFEMVAALPFHISEYQTFAGRLSVHWRVTISVKKDHIPCKRAIACHDSSVCIALWRISCFHSFARIIKIHENEFWSCLFDGSWSMIYRKSLFCACELKYKI